MSVAQQATTLMITNLRDELSRRRERVDKCREELEVAEADAEKFLAEVSASLGLRSRKAEKQYTPIERRKIVLNLYNAGKSNEEIAAELNLYRLTVDKDVMLLWEMGKLGSRTKNSDSVPPPPMRITLNTDDHAAPESDSDPVMTKLDGVGASKNELFDEVLRQQNGVRGKMVTLLTTVKNSHCHRVHIDRMGDGVTESDDSRHSH